MSSPLYASRSLWRTVEFKLANIAETQCKPSNSSLFTTCCPFGEATTWVPSNPSLLVGLQANPISVSVQPWVHPLVEILLLSFDMQLVALALLQPATNSVSMRKLLLSVFGAVPPSCGVDTHNSLQGQVCTLPSLFHLRNPH